MKEENKTTYRLPERKDLTSARSGSDLSLSLPLFGMLYEDSGMAQPGKKSRSTYYRNRGLN